MSEEIPLQVSGPADWLASDYVPPYGTDRSLEDFVAINPAVPEAGWQVSGRCPGDERLAEYRLVPADRASHNPSCRCSRNAKPLLYRDPVTLLGGDEARFSQWYDLILRADADARVGSKAAALWQGDQVGDMFRRLSANVVGYNRAETATANFERVDQLQAWLDGEAEAAYGRHFEVVELDTRHDDPFPRGLILRTLPAHRLTEQEEGLEGKLYSAVSPPNLEGPPIWFGEGRTFPQYGLWVSSSGARLEAVETVEAVALGDLTPYWSILDPPEGWSQWWAIRLMGSKWAVIFPKRHAMIEVGTDHDGASASVFVRPSFLRVPELQRRDDYRKRWARWLDDDVVLDKAELERGIALVEAEAAAAAQRGAS